MSKYIPKPTEVENEINMKLDQMGINIDIIRDVIKLIDLQEHELKKIERREKLNEIISKINVRTVVKRSIYSVVILDYLINRVLDYYLHELINYLT